MSASVFGSKMLSTIKVYIKKIIVILKYYPQHPVELHLFISYVFLIFCLLVSKQSKINKAYWDHKKNYSGFFCITCKTF